jgi:hypothetical protein
MAAPHIWTPFRDPVLSNTAQTIKSEPGTLGGWSFGNPHATDLAYVHLYDTADAVVVGTTVPTLSLIVPASGGNNHPISNYGIPFHNGLKIAASTTAAGSSAPTTALTTNVYYK